MEQNTRDRIINYLEINHLCTSDEISNALSMTKANIQYHLNKLFKDGIISVVKQTSKNIRGRPSFLYHLTEGYHENNYENICLAFIKMLGLDKTSGNIRAFEENIKKLAKVLFPFPPEENSDFIFRLNKTVDILNQHHYHARWEAHQEGPCLYINHCPYHSLLREIPDLCIMDHIFIQYLLNCSVKQTKNIIGNNNPSGYCKFIID